MTVMPLPQEALQFLPHRPPMAFVDRLLVSDGSSARAETTITADHLFAEGDGTLDPLALVEIFAQTYAAMQGYEDLRQGKPVKEGFLVGIRRIRVEGQVRIGDRIEVAVRTVGAIDGFAVAEGTLSRDGELLAEGSLKLWIPEPKTGGETDA